MKYISLNFMSTQTKKMSHPHQSFSVRSLYIRGNETSLTQGHGVEKQCCSHVVSIQGWVSYVNNKVSLLFSHLTWEFSQVFTSTKGTGRRLCKHIHALKKKSGSFIFDFSRNHLEKPFSFIKTASIEYSHLNSTVSLIFQIYIHHLNLH